ncbi:MAG: tetratricopeptide repeat protein, partial [Acidobacteria bacterium]|nr:tetratricopeptide repeat protein [Acidobacteriota bacterium]
LPREAVAPLRRAMELQPDVAEAHNNLALALLQAGRAREALQPLRRAVELRPEYAEARYNLAHALSAADQPDAAAEEFRAALQLEPDWPAALRDLATLLATHADAGVRDPPEAVRLAARAVDLVQERAADPDEQFATNPRDDALLLDALATAYAAAGRFDEAVSTAEDAEALVADVDPVLAGRIRRQRDRYRAGRPPFDTPVP